MKRQSSTTEPSFASERRSTAWIVDEAIRDVLPPSDIFDAREGISAKDADSKGKSLEDLILQDGEIREPLVIWQETNSIVDGFRRDVIAKKHSLFTSVIEKSFPDLLSAQSYRIQLHATRRNIRPHELARYLLSNQDLVASIKKEAQRRKKSGKKLGTKGDWMQVLADMAGIGRSTVYQMAKIIEDQDYGPMHERGCISALRAHKMIERRASKARRQHEIIEAGKIIPAFVQGDELVNHVHCCDVLTGLKAIPDASVELVFTSPPYPLLTSKLVYPEPAYSYDGDYPRHINWLTTVCAEAQRILRPGGRLILNTDNVSVPEPTPVQLETGRYDKDWQSVFRRNVYADLYSRITRDVGLVHLDDVVWWKGAYVGTRPARGSYLSAARPRLQRNWEDVTVYIKGTRDATLEGENGDIRLTPDEHDFWSGGDYDFNGGLRKERHEAGWEQDATVWRIAPDVSSRRIHPCAFPIELPWRLILLYTYQGNTVVDPFSGIGTTCAAAKALGRNYIGIEAVGGFIVEGEKRIERAYANRLKLRDEFAPVRKGKKRIRNYDEAA